MKAGALVVGDRGAEAKLAAAHQALKQAPGFQFDFGVAEVPKPPSWLDPILRFFEFIGPVMPYLFWGGVIAAAGVILYFILREVVPEQWFRRSRRVVATDWHPDTETAVALLDDADTLAAAGRFEAAIHLLLFRSIDDLAKRRPGVVRPAFTSRDIAALEVLPVQPRAAFASLARAVERTFFGGQPAGADAFYEARRDFEAFAFADGWR